MKLITLSIQYLLTLDFSVSVSYLFLFMNLDPEVDHDGDQEEFFISVDSLELLKTEFHVDEEGHSRGLPLPEFIRACAHVFRGKRLSEQDIVHLFMKIDANSDGTVDWNEFTNFMLMENQGHDKMMDEINGPAGSEFETYPVQKGGEIMGHAHKGMIDRIVKLKEYDKYVTISRDGTMSVWQAGTGAFQLNINPTIHGTQSGFTPFGNLQYNNLANAISGNNEKPSLSWMVDAAYLPVSNKLAVCSLDRTYYFLMFLI